MWLGLILPFRASPSDRLIDCILRLPSTVVAWAFFIMT
jgi:hypothetical protein